MRTIFSSATQNQFSVFSSQGFTLIELIVVFSILAVLSSVGMGAFISYDHTQTLQNARNDMASLLNLAKSRSSSQVVPAVCGTNSLSGYKVTIVGADYFLYVVCGADRLVEAKKLPQNISVDISTSTYSVLFPTVTGGVVGSGNIVLKGYGQTRTITITTVGGIQ